MNDRQQLRNLHKGLWACWLSLVILPIGIFFGAVGMCAGPRSKTGAFAILAVGIAGIAATIYSFFQVMRGFKAGDAWLRLSAIVSLFSAIVVGIFGAIYSLEAWTYIADLFRS
jgi:hypothetical protein